MPRIQENKLPNIVEALCYLLQVQTVSPAIVREILKDIRSEDYLNELCRWMLTDDYRTQEEASKYNERWYCSARYKLWEDQSRVFWSQRYFNKSRSILLAKLKNYIYFTHSEGTLVIKPRAGRRRDVQTEYRDNRSLGGNL